MVKVNRDIDCVAVWYLDHTEDEIWNRMSDYQQFQHHIVYFSKLLEKFKNNGLLLVKIITLGSGGFLYKEPMIIFENNSVNINKNTFDIIQCSEQVKFVKADEVCSDLYWIDLFKEWSGKDYTLPMDIVLEGDTLLYRNGCENWENQALSLYLGRDSFYIKTYLTDWMPYLLDAVTPNIDYEANFYRLRDTLIDFAETYNYKIIGESTRFAVLDGLNISHHVNYEGERIALDINGNFLD
ncbi:hypothetical protein [Acinetobacter guillouiae]|uniref:hypothetical protein n=1 Tax=Acinetobacter guillouiae TaxID=106649 RepID=UPI0033424FA1